MKNFKRFVALLILLVMTFSMVPLSVFAKDEQMVIICDVNTYKPAVGNFDCLYFVCSDDVTMIQSAIWTSSDESIATVNESGYVEFLSAGNVIITVTINGTISDSVEFAVAWFYDKVEKIIFPFGETLVGFVGTSQYVDYSVYPSGSFASVKVESSDESVVIADYQNLRFVGKGNAVVTFTDGKELSAEIQVTVLGAMDIEIDEVVEIDKTTSCFGLFKFVPEESGTYCFRSFDNAFSTCGSLYDSKFNELEWQYNNYLGRNFQIVYELEAGETYYFYSCPDSDNDINHAGSYSVKVFQPEPIKDIFLDIDEIDVCLDCEYKISADIISENSAFETLAISYSNKDVAYATYYDGCYYIDGMAIGSTTVTLTSSNGVKKSFVVNVHPYKELVLDKTNEMTDPNNSNYHYTFTPKETLEYFFDLNNTEDGCKVSIRYNSEELISFNQSCFVPLYGGVTYDVEVSNCVGSLTVSKSAYKSLEIIEAPSKVYIKGDGMFSYEESGKYELIPADLTGIKLRGVKNDGTVEIITDEDLDVFQGTLNGLYYDLDEITVNGAGSYKAKLYYAGFEFTYNVKVVENQVVGFDVIRNPDVDIYFNFAYPLFYGMTVRVAYANGEYEDIVIDKTNSKHQWIFDQWGCRVQTEKVELFVLTNDIEGYQPSNVIISCNGFISEYINLITKIDSDEIIDVEIVRYSEIGDDMKFIITWLSGYKHELTTRLISTEYENGKLNYLVETELGATYVSIDNEGNYDIVSILGISVTVGNAMKYTRGDVNGDNKLAASDYMMLKTVILGNKDVEDLNNQENAFNRCDYNGDGKLNATDYMMLKRSLLN